MSQQNLGGFIPTSYNATNSAPAFIDYIVVAGGGGGGGCPAGPTSQGPGCGGGAGGLLQGYQYAIVQSVVYQITVGAGGAGG